MGFDFLKNFNSLHLDIVGLLAILGESSVEATLRATGHSWLVLLPRIMPAPQVLLKVDRVKDLETYPGKVISVHGGAVRPVLNYLARLVHHGEYLKRFEIQVVKISCNTDRPLVRPKTFGATTSLIIIGFCEFLALFVFSVIREDGFALLATLSLACLSSLGGLCVKWTLNTRIYGRYLTKSGDTIIKYSNGAFLLVKCTVSISEMLFWRPNEIDHFLEDPRAYTISMILGSLMLMTGIISLSNAKLELQVAFGLAYIIINSAFWVVANLHRNLDLQLFDVQNFNVDFVQDAESNDIGVTTEATFTAALWRLISLTGEVDWIECGEVVPKNDIWRKWVKEAGRQTRLRLHQERRLNSPHIKPDAHVEPCQAHIRMEAQDYYERQNTGPPPTSDTDSIPMEEIVRERVPWDYQGYLRNLFEEEAAANREIS